DDDEEFDQCERGSMAPFSEHQSHLKSIRRYRTASAEPTAPADPYRGAGSEHADARRFGSAREVVVRLDLGRRQGMVVDRDLVQITDETVAIVRVIVPAAIPDQEILIIRRKVSAHAAGSAALHTIYIKRCDASVVRGCDVAPGILGDRRRA